MNLYVWEDVLCDWSCGIAFALAESESEARRLLIAKEPTIVYSPEFASPPEVHALDVPYANAAGGGG